MLFSHTTSKIYLAIVIITSVSCTVADQRVEEQLSGPISFPFGNTEELGRDGKREPFTIRSNTGDADYQVEFPGGGRDFDIEIPLAVTKPNEQTRKKSEMTAAQAIATDREMVSELPDMNVRSGAGSAVLDKAMGLGTVEGSQGPSYTLGMAKVRSHYASKNYEYALIEVNNLLSFFPGSPVLYKMKGSILLKLGHNKMAEKNWAKALDYSPTDRALQVALSRLRKKIELGHSDLNPVKTINSSSDIPQESNGH